MNRRTCSTIFTTIILGVSVYLSTLLVVENMGAGSPVSFNSLFIAVFYVNTINLLYMVLLAYIYVRYDWLFTGIVSMFVRFFGGVSEEYSRGIGRRVYEWTIRHAGLATGVVVTVLFIGSLWKTRILLGYPYPLTYILLKMVLLPHTWVELIAFYIAVWGTLRMHYRMSLVIGVSLTATLMLLAAAILEAYVSPILLYYYM